jgi:amidophosphoribosyltransferase
VEEIGKSLGADSLSFISIEGMVEATTQPKERLCRACFDGEYPMDLPDPQMLGKHLLEAEIASGRQQPAARGKGSLTDLDGVQTLLGGAGAADALRRP